MYVLEKLKLTYVNFKKIRRFVCDYHGEPLRSYENWTTGSSSTVVPSPVHHSRATWLLSIQFFTFYPVLTSPREASVSFFFRTNVEFCVLCSLLLFALGMTLRRTQAVSTWYFRHVRTTYVRLYVLFIQQLLFQPRRVQYKTLYYVHVHSSLRRAPNYPRGYLGVFVQKL